MSRSIGFLTGTEFRVVFYESCLDPDRSSSSEWMVKTCSSVSECGSGSDARKTKMVPPKRKKVKIYVCKSGYFLLRV